MARYIDADKLIEKIFPIGLVGDGKYTINAKAVKIAIDTTPTVDVAPKSEVEHTLFDLKKEIHDKAVYPEARSVKPYISLKVVDAIIINKMEEIKNERRK